jgi:hypothetical protein
MDKNKSIFGVFIIFLIYGCAGSYKSLEHLDDPGDNTRMIIGNILIENINQEFAFENWDMGVELVFLGKNDQDSTWIYNVTTDYHGYYCIPNISDGRYILKAVKLPLTSGQPVILVNEWNSADSKFYRMRHPERGFDFKSNWYPQKKEGRIFNFNILWFGLRTAQITDLDQKSVGEVLVIQSSKSLDGHRFYDNGYRYTRPDPLTYFKDKFPQSAWWKN